MLPINEVLQQDHKLIAQSRLAMISPDLLMMLEESLSKLYACVHVLYVQSAYSIWRLWQVNVGQ